MITGRTTAMWRAGGRGLFVLYRGQVDAVLCVLAEASCARLALETLPSESSLVYVHEGSNAFLIVPAMHAAERRILNS
jgi:hypothetical protein